MCDSRNVSVSSIISALCLLLAFAGLANVITFAYLGRVHMSLYTIGCTVSAAATLQIPQLLKMCTDFLLAELTVQTCVYVWNIAAAYGLAPVCEAARRFVLENFVQFAETPLFTQLTLEQISAFMQDDGLLLPSEVTAFQVRGQRLKSCWLFRRYGKSNSIRWTAGSRPSGLQPDL